MIQITKTNVDKYHAFLTQIYNILLETTKVSMTRLCAENQLHYNTIAVMQKGGLIACEGVGRKAEWTWTTIRPTEQMATELIKKINAYQPVQKVEAKEISRKPAPELAKKSFENTLPEAEANEESHIDQAIRLLKNNGYRIQKLVYVEV